MQLTLTQLSKVMKGSAKAASFLAPLNAAMREFDIDTSKRVAYFLAQIAHESGALAFLQENLNYSAEGLCKTWPTRFPTLASATPYARNPQKIANKVYANRGGNGDEASGMGWKHRGAGLIQLTFYDNQKKCADYFGIDVNNIGDWLRTEEGACRSAAWFWKKNGCNEFADKADFDAVSDAINLGRQTKAEGDAIGYKDRLDYLRIAQSAIV